jgi:hypothetical protein
MENRRHGKALAGANSEGKGRKKTGRREKSRNVETKFGKINDILAWQQLGRKIKQVKIYKRGKVGIFGHRRKTSTWRRILKNEEGFIIKLNYNG